MNEYLVQMRKARGKKIAETQSITKTEEGFKVRATHARKRAYLVQLDGNGWNCSCLDYKEYGAYCKHIYAVQHHHYGGVDEPEPAPDTPLRQQYRRNMSRYNVAQRREAHEFMPLLYDLCQTIEERDHKRGRKPIPYSDIVFAAVMKVYTTKSTRLSMPMIDLACEYGFISKPLSFTSIWAYLEKPELSPILRNLIIASSRPLALVETIFAYDSTGFTGSRYRQWRDPDYRGQRELDGMKVHLGCGVKTNIVTDAIVSQEGDGRLLPQMLQTTGLTFQVKEVLADAAYNSVRNQEEIAARGATAFIPFKDGLTGASGGDLERAFHYFKYRQEEFRLHYHKRSNVESTNSMIGRKFGHYLRSKTKVAMTNESLAKIVCHNICCLIRACYELEIDAELLPEAFTKNAAD
jgi:transposase